MQCTKCKIDKSWTYEFFRYRDNTKTKLRKDCRECGHLHDKQYHVDHREQRRQYGIQWRNSEHGKTIREANRPKQRQLNRELRQRVLSAYCNNQKPYCQCCGENFLEFLNLDHVFGGGTKERKEYGLTGVNIYRYLEKLNYPDKEKYRVLCANCNTTLARADWTFESLKDILKNRWSTSNEH